MQQAETVSQNVTSHAITAFSGTVKNSSADAQTNACEALQDDINAQNVVSEAQTKLDEKKSELPFLNKKINALAPKNTEEEQAVLIKNREEARRESAEADRAHYEASRPAERAEFAERKATNSLLTASATGNSTAISAAEQVEADAQVVADAAEQAEADAQAAADASAKAANEAEALEIDSEFERKAQAAKAKELIALAEQVKADAEEADRAYYEALRAAERAEEAEREAMNSLVTVTAAGNSTAIADAEQAADDAQAAAKAAEQAEADAQAEAEAEAEAAAQADAEADAAAGKDDDITTPVYVSAAPASAVDDTNVAVPAAIMLINNPVAIEVEEIVDELIFTESNVEDLLIGAGVAVGMVELKTDGGDWQTLNQDVTNSLALGAYDEELEIRVTSNDAEPVIVEKTVEVVRVQTAAQ